NGSGKLIEDIATIEGLNVRYGPKADIQPALSAVYTLLGARLRPLRLMMLRPTSINEQNRFRCRHHRCCRHSPCRGAAPPEMARHRRRSESTGGKGPWGHPPIGPKPIGRPWLH